MRQPRRSRWGTPVPVPPRSYATVQVVDLSEAMDVSRAPTNLTPGSTVSAANWIMRENALVPRPGETVVGSGQDFGMPIRGGADIVTSENIHYQIISSNTALSVLTNNAWSRLSWIPGVSNGRPPIPSITRWDITQSVRSDGSVVAFLAPTSSSASPALLQCWLPGETTWSCVTGLVMATSVAAYDNYLLAWSTGSVSGNTGIKYPTRVMWSDRGDCLTWEPGASNLCGYEDLLDAKGGGTVIKAQEDRVILFTELEIWEGRSTGIPGVAQFIFNARDRSVGCTRPRTVVQTPEGLMFIGNDNYLYLLPKVGGPATPLLSAKNALNLRNFNAGWAVWNAQEHRYELYEEYSVDPLTGEPLAMTAEIDAVTATQVTGSSALISWTNELFFGDEQIEVWVHSDSLDLWYKIATVNYSGDMQSYTVTGLTASHTYNVGLRAVRGGVTYTSGFESSNPDEWLPSGGRDPFSGDFQTLGQPNPPTDLQVTSTFDYSFGGKDYRDVTIEWLNAASGPTPYYTEVVQEFPASPTTLYSVVSSMLTTNQLWMKQGVLLTPFADETTFYYHVRHVDISGLTSVPSSTVSFTNSSLL